MAAGIAAAVDELDADDELRAGAGAALLLAQRIPQAIALEMLLTGDPVTAQRAAELGLVDRDTFLPE